MSGGSVFVSGTLTPCPERFNAAAHCLVSGGAGDTALIAVRPGQTGRTQSWTFADLRDRVLRANGALRDAGVGAGDRVVILLGDTPDFPIAYFGAIAAGAVATPLSSQLSPGEIARILTVTEPAVVVAPPGLALPGDVERLTAEELSAGLTADFAPIGADDPALLVFTSGSSGRPKGVLHAHRAFWARRAMHDGWHGIGPGDRVMHAGAFNWTYTLGVGLADTWSVGGTAILNAGTRAPDIWPGIARQTTPTVFAAAPAVFRRILKYGEDLKDGFASLRHAVTAGEALSPEIADAWRRATAKPILEALGMSEVSTYVSTPPGRAPVSGSVGWPQPGRQVAVLGDDGVPVPWGTPGVLAVHRTDPGLMLGYWRDGEATNAAFAGDWFLTGDVVRMGKDGAISYAGRRDDQMNAQGYRVDPGEVEAALLQCAGVAECGVTEWAVEAGLSVIAAWLVVEDGAALSRQDILDEIAPRLAAYKRPRLLFLTDALPRTANGKLIRRRLPETNASPL